MSTRDDARLTARERAALASLESTAAAEDPELAARLTGTGGFRRLLVIGLRLTARLRTLPPWMRSRWWGVPAVIVGLVLAVLSMSIGLPAGVVGVAVATWGLWLTVTTVEDTWASVRGEPPPE